jgi:hypothetical protein
VYETEKDSEKGAAEREGRRSEVRGPGGLLPYAYALYPVPYTLYPMVCRRSELYTLGSRQAPVGRLCGPGEAVRQPLDGRDGSGEPGSRDACKERLCC